MIQCMQIMVTRTVEIAIAVFKPAFLEIQLWITHAAGWQTEICVVISYTTSI